jgi:ABC-type branched-subunit amino acid transport system substrate-binding protein
MDEIRAMQALIKAGKKVTRSSVLSAVRSASYRGVTGTFAFDQKGNDLYRLGFSLYTCDLKGVWHYQRALQ